MLQNKKMKMVMLGLKYNLMFMSLFEIMIYEQIHAFKASPFEL